MIPAAPLQASCSALIGLYRILRWLQNLPFDPIRTVWLHPCSIPTPGSSLGHCRHTFVTVLFQAVFHQVAVQLLPARILSVFTCQCKRCSSVAASSAQHHHIAQRRGAVLRTHALHRSCSGLIVYVSGLALDVMGFERLQHHETHSTPASTKAWVGLRRAVCEAALVILVVTAQL